MFQSARRLPYLSTYEGAKKWHDQIRPLRSGARMGRRPLGGRKDTFMYIQENAEGSMECVLYDTALVTFKQDGGVVVTPGKWPSSFTCAFIEGLLPDTSANRTKGMVILHLNRRDTKHPLKQDQSIELVRIPVEPGLAGRWEVRNAEGVHVWTPNRAKANSVRAKYKEMIGYHKGIVSLLTQEREKSNEDDPFEAAKILALPKDMLADSLGTTARMEGKYLGNGQHTLVESAYIDMELFNKAANHKPTWAGYSYSYEVGSPEYDMHKMQTQKRREDWLAIRDEVLALMCNDQPEETKHANFLKASLGLMCTASGVRSFSAGVYGVRHKPVELSYSKAAGAVTQFLTLAFAEEIMELKQMPVGRVPTTNYADMLFDEFRKQGEMK